MFVYQKISCFYITVFLSGSIKPTKHFFHCRNNFQQLLKPILEITKPTLIQGLVSIMNLNCSFYARKQHQPKEEGEHFLQGSVEKVSLQYRP